MTTTEFAALVPCDVGTIGQWIARGILPPPGRIVRVNATGHKKSGYDWPAERVDEVRAIVAASGSRRAAGGLRGSRARADGRRHDCRHGLRYRDGQTRLCVLGAAECEACRVRMTIESVVGGVSSSAGDCADVGAGR